MEKAKSYAAACLQKTKTASYCYVIRARALNAEIRFKYKNEKTETLERLALQAVAAAKNALDLGSDGADASIEFARGMYMRARYASPRLAGDFVRSGLAELDKLLLSNPNHARGLLWHAGLTLLWLQRGGRPDVDGIGGVRAREMADRAIAICPTLKREYAALVAVNK